MIMMKRNKSFVVMDAENPYKVALDMVALRVLIFCMRRANFAPVINHRLHPLHPLMLVVRNHNNWYCDVCDSKGLVKGFSYWCRSCDFDACTKCGLATTLEQEAATALEQETLIKFKHEGHPQHTLTLQLRSGSFRCDACLAKDEDLFYQCTSLVEECTNEFLHFPMPEPFTDPLKLLHLEKVSLDDDGATEISHWSHDHPLILNVEPQGSSGQIRYAWEADTEAEGFSFMIVFKSFRSER
ncbi:hypothetical protein L6452_31748 [Arctium lappa]|uniref:Uncharacterized protein n=1 Tax=Arctium lappa TaxID=4217 RepID=A0ACB8Z6V7_ARCLA|nr:hypothetical protein L6452_31748 [Arctium lappa]